MYGLTQFVTRAWEWTIITTGFITSRSRHYVADVVLKRWRRVDWHIHTEQIINSSLQLTGKVSS